MQKIAPTDWEKSIPQLNKGNGAIFDSIRLDFFVPLCQIAKKIVRDDVITEMIVRETILRLWEQRAEFTSANQIKTFLYEKTAQACFSFEVYWIEADPPPHLLKKVWEGSLSFVNNEIKLTDEYRLQRRQDESGNS